MLAWTALVVLCVQATTLSRLQWIDAYVGGLVDTLRDPAQVRLIRSLSADVPFLAGAAVLSGLGVALWRGARPADLGRVLLGLGIGLVWIEALKLAIVRDRPLTFPKPGEGDSFPSGHTAQLAICIVATLHLLATSRRSPDRLRTLVLWGGVVLVPIVGLMRLYTDRHWFTDVTAGMLFGVAFWGLTAQAGEAPPGARRGSATLAFTFVGLALCLLGAGGVRITLPAPVSIDGQPHLDLPIPSSVVSGDFRLRFHARTPGEHAVLQLIGASRPWPSWARLDVSVDGRPAAGRPLDPEWRVYTFALPALGPGPHELALEASPSCPSATSPIAAAVALRRVSIKGMAGDFDPVVASRRPVD